MTKKTEIKKVRCNICSAGCPIDAYVQDGKLLSVEGSRDWPGQQGGLCSKGAASRQYVYNKDRILYPMKRVGERGSGEFERISWEEAYAMIANNLLRIREKYGSQSTVFYAGYPKWYRPALLRLANAYGSPNYCTESSTCFQSAAMAWRSIYGNNICFPDMMHAKTVLVWSNNLYYSNISMAPMYQSLKERGVNIISVDPRETVTSQAADLHLKLIPGTDGALALSMGQVIIEENLYDHEFVEKYVGVGAKRVRTLFEKARKEAPSIIFIDEIDAIGARRHSESNNEKDQTLNQLLVEMDGFNKDDNIIIVGATNRLDLLDEALLRPGRFDRHIRINSPNYNSRYEILKVHTQNKPLHKDVDLKLLARKTHGFNGAHLANIANEAAIFAVRDDSHEITTYHFDKAIERVIAGIEQKNSVLIEKEKRIVSFHEAGHAIVSNIVNICPIQKISIVPRGEALGYVLQLPDEDRYIYTKDELIGKLKILLAGKAAEEVIFNHMSTGAKDDLKKVTDIANQMVCEYGMSKLGFMTIEGNSKSFMSDKVQKEANSIVENCYKETLKLINENINDLHIVANYLYDKEVMTLEELKSLIQKEPC